MSFGKSSSKQSSSLDPQIKSAILDNYANAQQFAGQPYQPYTGQMVAPLTQAQQQAGANITNLVNSNVGGAELNSAMGTANGVAGYSPMSVHGSTYNPMSSLAALSGGYSPANLTNAGYYTGEAAQLDPSSIQQISAPTVGADQISAYMNPYEQQVVDATMADLERQRQIQQTYNAAQATNNGAWGGTGMSVLQGMTNDDFARQEATAAANLRAGGWQSALAAAQQQAGLQQNANLANQSTALQGGTANADLLQAMGLANLGYGNQSELANAAAANQMAQYNAGNVLQNQQFNAVNQQQTNLANQNAANQAAQYNAGNVQAANIADQLAALQGQQLRLQAAQQQAALSGQQVSQSLGLQNALNAVGQQQQQTQQNADTAAYNQYLAAQQWPVMMQELLNQTLGLAGNPVLGKGSSSGFNFALPSPSPSGGG